jgi:hypothetical protein
MGIGAMFAHEKSNEMRDYEESGEDLETGEFWDAQTGEILNQEMVRRAIEEEMGEVRKHQVRMKVPIAKCWTETGKASIGTQWIDVNKGDIENPEYRSEQVAKEIHTHNREDLFAATPPLKARKMLISLAMTEGIGFRRGGERNGMKL